MNETTPQSQGWAESIASKLNFDSFLKNFNLTTAIVIETASYFAAGIVLGVLIKRYFKQVVIGLFLFVVMIKGLEYVGVGSMVFDWNRIKTLTGIGPNDTLDSVAKFYWAWVQTHVRQVISGIIGLLVGIKLS